MLKKIFQHLRKTLYLSLMAFILCYSCLLSHVTLTKAETLPSSDVPQTLSASDLHLPPLPVEKKTGVLGGDKTFPRQQTFLISAYYSPLPGQAKYVTGSYAGDIRLNGDGVKAADGTHVYPGMIAAPKSYSFGTKMAIPNIGTVAVHDRGGAIVHSGERGNAHDRLDVWMGYGDAGLKRALNWGKRTLEVTVYGVNPDITEEVRLEGYSDAEKYAISNTLTPGLPDANSSVQTSPVVQTNNVTFLSSSLSFGSKGEDVTKLQESLKKLGYYSENISGLYDRSTVKALSKFQVAENIIRHEHDYGAGHFGPKTVKILAKKLSVSSANAQQQNVTATSNIFQRDLRLGDNGEDVRKLQDELKRLHLLGIDPTGYYSDVTAHAVFKFQQTQLLAGNKESVGAGIFGPKTRAVLNSLLAQREQMEQLIAANRKEEGAV